MSGFEPTEAQEGVDRDWFSLINPDAIPYPESDVWSLNYAAETLRSGGEAISGGAEGMRSTWHLLGVHYEAPESERLFAAMDPVVTRGDDLESDLRIVASALEDLAEAARTARLALNTLRIQAQAFHNRYAGNDTWWLEKDEDTEFGPFVENQRLKTEVNQAWSTFTQAENECANKVSALFDGHTYVTPDEATGSSREIVYGLPPLEGPGVGLNSGTARDIANDFTGWAGERYDPAKVEFENKEGQALYDTLVVGFLWGGGVSLANKTGVWTSEHGWAVSSADIETNKSIAATNILKDGLGMVGLYGQGGLLYSPLIDPDEDFSGSRWGEWWGNTKDNWGEAWEGFSGWSQRESSPEYTGTTTAVNTVMLVGLAPIKIGSTLLNIGSSPDAGGGSAGDGDGHSGSDPNSRLPGWMVQDSESVQTRIPLPDTLGDGTTPTTTRHGELIADLDIPIVDSGRGPEVPSPRPRGDGPAPPPPGPRDEGGSTPAPRPQNEGSPTPVPGSQGNDVPGPGPRPNEDSPQQGGTRGERENTASRNDAQRSEGGNRTDHERPGAGQDRNGTGRGREGGDDRAGTGPGGREPDGSRSENSQDRQNRSDERAVPPRTGDTRADDGTSTTANNTNSETTGGRGNTSEDTSPNTRGEASSGGGTNGGGASGNGGGDGGGPSDPAAGTEGGSRPPGPRTLAEFEKHRWGDKNDPAAKEAFRRDVEYLVNNDEDFRRKYYNAANSRVREDLKIGLEQWQLPKLHVDKATGRLTPLAAPDSPNFIGDKTSVRFNRSDFLKGPDGKPLVGDELARKTKLREEFSGLDELAVDRREKIDRAKQLDDDFKAAEADHGKYKENGSNHPDVERAHREKTNAYHESTLASEKFGERSADVAARYEFDGGPLLDKNGNPVMRDVLDDSGNKIGEQAVVKPNLDGARLLGQASGAPGNGNAQFDLIYETAGGEVVIIEAKSSTRTSLGTRVHQPEEGPVVDTMQGTSGYVDSILDAMDARGNGSQLEVGDKTKIPNARGGEGEKSLVGERDLSAYIEKKMDEGKVTYALFKGDPRAINGSESANGYDYQIFDIG